jgi:hypothetical protein
MSSEGTLERTSCPVCHDHLFNNQTVARHMQRWHPVEWANSRPGRQVIHYPCDRPGCNMLGTNTRYDYYVDHLNRVHGIDQPSMMRTTERWYLEAKNKAILEMHVVQEARELNELNAQIRNLEICLASDPPPGGYTSRHGFDVRTSFATVLARLPQTKAGLVVNLQEIRNCRNEVGMLFTKPGVADTRDGVLNDLETLLDSPDADVVDGLEAMLDHPDGVVDDSETIVESPDDDEDLGLLLDSPKPVPDMMGPLLDPLNLDPDALEELLNGLHEALGDADAPLASQ